MAEHISLDSLLDESAFQNVVLHEQLQNLHFETSYPTHTPTAMSQVAAVAGDRIVDAFQPLLSDRPLLMTEQLVNDPAARAFVFMTQDTLCPYDETDVFHIARATRYGIDTCKRAEPYFATTLKHLEFPERAYENVGAQIILDRSGEPVLLRKRYGEPSALALSRIAIDGIRYPVGSIVRLNLKSDTYTKYPDDHKPDLPYAETTVQPAEAVASARFLRLSAYSYPPEARQPFLWSSRNDTQASVEAMRFVAEVETDAIRDMAASVASKLLVASMVE